MSKYEKFYDQKTTLELLEILKSGKVYPETIDKEWYDALVVYLNQKNLSGDDKLTLNQILNADVESLKAEVDTKKKREFHSDSYNERSLHEVQGMDNFNPAPLKVVSGLLSTISYIVAATGLIVLFLFCSRGEYGIGLITLLSATVVAIPLYAYSQVILLFLNIEHNTRKTREKIEKQGN